MLCGESLIWDTKRGKHSRDSAKVLVVGGGKGRKYLGGAGERRGASERGKGEVWGLEGGERSGLSENYQ